MKFEPLAFYNAVVAIGVTPTNAVGLTTSAGMIDITLSQFIEATQKIGGVEGTTVAAAVLGALSERLLENYVILHKAIIQATKLGDTDALKKLREALPLGGVQ